MLPLLDDRLHLKKLRHHMSLSRDIDNQRILQCDWTGGATSLTQSKVVVSYPTLITSMQKIFQGID